MCRPLQLEIIKKRDPNGKLNVIQPKAEVCIVTSNNRLCVLDKNSGLKFLIDTGANVSVIPVTNCKNIACDKYKLYAANGTEIRTYGVRSLVLDLNLRRAFRWTFIVADVSNLL